MLTAWLILCDATAPSYNPQGLYGLTFLLDTFFIFSKPLTEFLKRISIDLDDYSRGIENETKTDNKQSWP